VREARVTFFLVGWGWGRPSAVLGGRRGGRRINFVRPALFFLLRKSRGAVGGSLKVGGWGEGCLVLLAWGL